MSIVPPRVVRWGGFRDGTRTDCEELGTPASSAPHICSGSPQRLGLRPRKWHPAAPSSGPPRFDSAVPLGAGRAGPGVGGWLLTPASERALPRSWRKDLPGGTPQQERGALEGASLTARLRNLGQLSKSPFLLGVIVLIWKVRSHGIACTAS